MIVPLEFACPARLTSPSDAVVHELTGGTMGTTWSVKIAGARSLSLALVGSRIRAVLARIIAQMSTWEEQSDISRFNRASPGTWHTLPQEFAHVLAHGLELAGRTDGAYDPTIGSLVDLWGFGSGHSGRAARHLPDDHEIASVRACCGHARLRFEHSRRRLRQPGGLRLDLSSVAKGFAVDAVSRSLAEMGYGHHLVEIGGELRGSGVKPGGLPWWVAIESPANAPHRAQDLVIALSGWSVATSGDYRRTRSLEGHLFSHTIDPRSGRPLANALASVSVLDKRCMAADALATALLVMGLEQGLSFAEVHGIPAMFLARRPSGLTPIFSPALEAMREEGPLRDALAQARAG